MRPTVGTCTMAIPPTASCGPFRKITIMNEHIIEAVSSTVDLGRCAAKCIAGEPMQVGTDISATHHPSSALPGQPPHDALATVQAPVVRGLIDLLRQDLFVQQRTVSVNCRRGCAPDLARDTRCFHAPKGRLRGNIVRLKWLSGACPIFAPWGHCM